MGLGIYNRLISSRLKYFNKEEIKKLSAPSLFRV